MAIFSPRFALVLVLSLVCVLASAPLTVVQAEDELWVRRYRGGTIGGPDRALDLAIHPSGDVTVAGLSCNEFLVARLDSDGNELWSHVESSDKDFFFGYQTKVVAAGEEAVVATEYSLPYYEWYRDLYRYSPSGDVLWEREWLPIAAMTGDGSGGALLGGNTFTGDLCACPAYVARIGPDGGTLWQNIIRPEGYEALDGDVDALATDGSEAIFVASNLRDQHLTQNSSRNTR